MICNHQLYARRYFLVFLHQYEKGRAESASQFRNAKISTNLSGQWIGNLCVTWHGGASIVGWIAPPRMTSSFADERATMFAQVTNQLAPLQDAKLTSS